MAITKNRQTEETIRRMAKKAFPESEVTFIRELTEGMCNVTYRVGLDDGRETILKITAKDARGRLSNEINLMDAEVRAMELVRQSGAVRAAQVYAYDRTKTVCDSDYFFMEALAGDNLILVRDSLSPEELAQINEESGRVARALTGIQNDRFGLLGDTERFDDLYNFIRKMLCNLLHDAREKSIPLGIDEAALLEKLARDKACFDAVTQPTLVHWDMWEGNIFVKDGHITGIIDWERALWGEAFMDDRFRRHNRGADFLRGYGQTEFSPPEAKRLAWYDVILYLTMMIEVTYRQYEDDSQYHWAKGMLAQAEEELR